MVSGRSIVLRGKNDRDGLGNGLGKEAIGGGRAGCYNTVARRLKQKFAALYGTGARAGGECNGVAALCAGRETDCRISHGCRARKRETHRVVIEHRHRCRHLRRRLELGVSGLGERELTGANFDAGKRGCGHPTDCGSEVRDFDSQLRTGLCSNRRWGILEGDFGDFGPADGLRLF